jgi:hypothetical protein
MHGGWGGTLYRVVFDPDEYIVALNGTAGLYLDSLSIVTNKRTLTYGSGGDTPFSFAAPAGHEIVGLYGRAGGLFDNTGAIERVRSSVPFTTEPPTGTERPLVKLSPIVGYNHEPAIPYQDTVPDDAQVIAFGVRRGETLPPGETLRQLQFWYRRSDGSIYTVGPRGFSSVGSMVRINFDADEYITAFVGKAGEFLDSLSIVTNKRTYGPWGGPGGDRYTIATPAGYEIVGMFGRHSLGLDNTGFFARQRR